MKRNSDLISIEEQKESGKSNAVQKLAQRRCAVILILGAPRNSGICTYILTVKLSK
jgi:hypothetical protein